MDPIFIALEPDERFASVVTAYKDRTRTLVGDQQYLDDPPHLTLYLSVFEDTDRVKKELSALAVKLRQIEVTIVGWHVFESDPLTGLHTLTCDMNDADREALRDIQKQVVERLAPLRDRDATLAWFKPRWGNLSEAESRHVESIGFPYVGAAWHPHFTIASIRQEDWAGLWRQLEHNGPTGIAFCTKLNVYRLVGKQPELIETFEL